MKAKKSESKFSSAKVSLLRRGLLAAVLMILMFMAFSATASAGVINVPKGDPTIQQAINNVTATNRTILVNATAYAGTTETVIVNKSDIIIRSVNGTAVVSAGGASDHVFNITDQTNVTLQGFEIRDAASSSSGRSVAGIYMYNASECNISDNVVTNIRTTSKSMTYGIYLSSSSDNSFHTTTVYNLYAKEDNAYGIYLSSSSNNSFYSSTVYNLSAKDDYAYGIYLASSCNNSFRSGSISKINAPIWWDFYSDENSHGNSAENITISSHPTTISFTYDNGVRIKSVETPPADHALKSNIGKYVDATNVMANSWLFLNVSYNESDLGGVDENSLRMWKHNGADWTEVPGTNGTNTTENYVYANITEFGSIFAPLGNTSGPPGNCTCGDICVNETGWWRDGGAFHASNTPIQHAIDIATAGETICVKNGTYNESVDVTKSHLTIRSENGSSVTTVSASLSPDEHVFNISDQTNVTLEGFTIRDAYGANKDVAGIYMNNASECNISNNVVTNISATSTYTAYGVWLNASDNSVFKNISMPGGISSGGVAYGLYLEGSNNNSMQNTTLGNITAEVAACGIMLGFSNNNSIDPKMGNIVGNSGPALGVGLFGSDENDIASVDFGFVAGGDGEAHGIRIEDSEHNNLSLNMTSQGFIGGFGTSVSGVFMHNANFTRITGIEFGAIMNFKTGDTNTYGIYMDNSNDNFLDPAIGNVTNDGHYATGLLLTDSRNNTVENTALGNITAEVAACGIMLEYSDNNSIDPKMGNIVGNSGPAFGVGLFESDENDIASVDFGVVAGGDGDAHGIYIEDSEHNNLSLNMTSHGLIGGNGTNVSGVFMHNANFTRITGIEFGAIMNFKTGDTNTYGIYMENSNDNFLDPAIGNVTNEGDYASGLLLTDSRNNTVENTTLGNITAELSAGGIMLEYSDNNSIDPKMGNIESKGTAFGGAFGVVLVISFMNEITSLDFGAISGAGGEAHGIYIEDSEHNNLSLNMTSQDDIIGNGTSVSGVFMHNANFTRITGIEFGAIRNIKTGATNTYGIYMENSNDNFLDPAIGNITNEGQLASGLWLIYSINNTVENTTLGNITAEQGACGIMLGFSNNNTFSSGSISDVNAPTWWDFYSDASSHRNSAENITISSYPTTISFTYDNGVGIKSVETPPPDPALKSNISKYVNATNVTANSWLFLNVSYNESDLGGVDEATLKMYRYNGTSGDWELADGSGINGVNQVANYVYANLTEFSVFAPLGNPTVNCTCGDICVNETGWGRDGGAFNASNTSIQHAIDNATAGDTICVKDGTYHENVIVNKSDIMIRSDNGSSVTTIKSNATDMHVVSITDQTNVTLEGFEIRDANGTIENVAGIYMKNASECNISGNVVTNISATHDARGIYLYYSSNNNSFHTSTVYNLSAGNAYGISLHSSSNNSFYSSTTVSDIDATNYAFGILLESSSNNNSFHTSTVYNLSANEDDAYGIFLSSSSNNSFHTSTVYNLSANEDDAYGIYLYSSSNNSFSSGSISDITAPDWWNFHSDKRSHRNSAENITISSFPTTISFTYDNGIGIKSVETSPQDPAGKVNISKYVNAANVTVNSWLFLNVSYNESDLGGVDEATLKMYRYNGTSGDWELADGSGINGVNQVANYVYANLTEFSVFAPLGNPTVNCTCGDICVNTSGWWRNNSFFNVSGTPIQAAVNNANADETICVKDGNYNENVNVNKRLTIQSENGSALTIVNASNPSWYVFEVTASYVNISGFTVKDGHSGIYLGNNVAHCNISDNNATNNTDGFRLGTSSHDNTLTNNTANSNSEAGIFCWTSSDNSLTNNTANSNDYGFWLHNSSNNNSLTNNTANSNNKDGFLLHDSSNNNTLTNNNASGNKGIGIYLWVTSQNNNLTSNKISGNELSGIELRNSCGNNKIQDNNISLNTNDAIFVDESSNNSRIIANNLSFNGHYGIHLKNAHKSNITGNIILSNSWAGTYLESSSDNNLSNNNASNNTNYDFYSNQNSHNNTVKNLTISSYPTTVSFTHDNGIGIKGVTTPEPDPAGKVNVSKYVNATNVTADSWIFMNVSYEDGDLDGVDENSLRMWKHNGTNWTEVQGTNGVNTAENYVYANITEFSVFAPLGNVTGAPPNITSTTASQGNVTNCTYLNLSVTVKSMEGGENCSGIASVKVNVTKLNGTAGWLDLDLKTGTIYDGTWNGTVHVTNTTDCDTVNLEINATDNSGNSNTSEYFTITIDNQVPETVNPITPWQYVTNCTSFNLSVNASDSCSGIKNITVNASAINTTAGNVTLTHLGGDTYNATVHVNTTNTGGNYTLTIYAYDWAGNVNDTRNFEFYIDNTPPSVTVIEPSELCVKNCTTITLRATVTDAGGSGVNNVTVDVSAINSTQDNVSLTFDGTYWTNTVHVSTPNQGLQNLTITAYDNKNNKNDSVNMTVKVDNIPPVAEVGSDQLDVAVNEALTFNASGSSDSYSCCNISNYSWDFGDGNNATGMEVTHSYNTAGNYMVTLNVTDCAGNNDTDTLNVSVTQELYNIPLHASSGWNLISTPLMPLNDSIENVVANISDNLDSVWAYRYNSTSGSMEWLSYDGAGGAADTLHHFEAGWGYWMGMTSADTLTIKGTFFPIGGENPPPTYYVYTGWNLVGFHSQTNKYASIYLANLGTDWSSLYKYSFGGPYEQILANENMERGFGYWLSMRANRTIAP